MFQYIENFKRYENKYMLTRDQYKSLMKMIQSKVKVDKHGKHTICNIYLDTEDYQLIRASIENPNHKEKIRIRSYGVPRSEDTVFVEVKKKHNGVVYKRRVPMTLEQMEHYLADGEIPEVESIQNMQEIEHMMNVYHPDSRVYIAYERIAMAGIEDPALRITFDSDIRWRDHHLHLNEGTAGEPILNQNLVLMEIKTLNAMPVWLSVALKQLEIKSSSFSKYGACYKQNIASTPTKLKRSLRL